MKTLSFALGLLFLSTPVFAGLPPTSSKGSGESVYSTTFKTDYGAIPITRSGTTATLGTIPVTQGGTGRSSLTANYALLGNGTSAVQMIAPGATGNMLVSDGTTWASSSVSGTTLVSAPGVTSPKVCYYAFGGASATLATPTNCTTGTCVEVLDTCTAISAPSRTGSGVYENITIANGTFANSSSIDCKCNAFDTANVSKDCRFYSVSADQTWSTTASGGYVGNIFTNVPAAAAADAYIQVKCEGRAP